MNRIAWTILFLLSGICYSQENFQLSGPIPVDPEIRKGKLENGLTYYIKENQQPKNRVEMRLVVNAGSLQETENQQGLAHFVEHMCFNGTKNFEKNELVNFLEKMGIEFGADLNAYTSFGETVYFLQLPTQDKSLLDTGILVLKDWAHNVSFEPEEIDKERGVIVEEWRLGLGAQRRMMQEYIPVLLKDSRYAKRLPIGEMDVVKNAPYDTLRQYYRDWYRPDLMAVIVAGDIDGDEMESKIRKQFASLENPPDPKPRNSYDIPENRDPLISIVTDKEATYTIVQFFIKHDKQHATLVEDYRRFLLHNLFNTMLNSRFRELVQDPDAPFIQANSRYGSFLGRSKDAYSSFAVAKSNQITASFDMILEENHKVREHGFTESELKRAKDNLLTFYEEAVKEKDKNESSSFAAEYKRNFLENEPIPGIEKEYAYANAFIPKITLQEVNALAGQWIIDKNWAILITAPEQEGVEVPEKDQIRKIIADSWTEETQAYVDDIRNEPLLESVPEKGAVISKKRNRRMDYTELRFENGARVVLKPNDYKNSEILFLGQSMGGHSVYPMDTFMSAYAASDIINRSGAGSFSEVQLEKKLAGKTVQLSTGISTLYERLRGSCSPDDLETLLTLNYLYFTRHEIDSNAFKTYINELKNRTAYIWSDPRYVFYDTIVKTATRNHPREITVPTTSQINRINFAQVEDVFHDRFSNAGEFTFFIIGNFDTDTIMPMLETYIGGLPSTTRTETWKDVAPEFPEQSKYVYVYKGTEPQSRVAILMKGAFDWENDKLAYTMLNKILSIKLRQTMREDQGGVYYTSVDGSYSKFPDPRYNLYISFGCSPENADSLAYTVFDEMKKIIREGPDETSLEKVQQSILTDRETNKVKNSYWMNQLQQLYFYDDPIPRDRKFERMVKKVKPEDIQKMAEKYYDVNQYIMGILYPENVDLNKK